MDKRGIRDILSETRDGVSGIEEDTRKQVEALMERYEKDKESRIKMGNEALRSAVTNDLLPRHEQFELAIEEIDKKILDVIGALSALDYEEDKTIRQMKEEREKLGVKLSFLRLALGVTKSVRDKLGELMKKLTRGIGEDDLAWYINPKNSRSTYYSVLTIDERLREKEEGDFPDRYGGSETVPILYLGKKFKELKGKRPGEWKEDEDRSKTEERIARKLAEFTKQGLMPPVSIELYPDTPYGIDFTEDFEPPFDDLRSDRCFVIVVKAECF